MKNISPFIALVVFIAACNGGSSDMTKEDTLTAKTDSSAAVVEQNDKSRNVEINEHPGLDTGSVVLKYQGLLDTIHGFVNKDTLYTDGDIKIVIPSQHRARGIGTTDNLWLPVFTGRVTIPYDIEPGFPHPERIQEALDMWQSKLPLLKFVRTAALHDHILFKSSKNTQSNIGRIGGTQTIEISDDAIAGNVAHEVGHGLGLYHEQCRPDRNKFVKVLCPNDVNYRHVFKTDPYAIPIGAYDYNSIMHYPRTECLTFPNLPDTANPGQRIRLSAGDIEAIKKLYHFH